MHILHHEVSGGEVVAEENMQKNTEKERCCYILYRGGVPYI